MDKQLLIPDKKLTTDQSNHTTEVQLDESIVFFAVSYMTMSEGLQIRSSDELKDSNITKKLPSDS